MIRLATEADFKRPIEDESRLRIHSLYHAYGIQVPFIQYYADEIGSLLAIMDGVGFFSPAQDALLEEWSAFLSMHPDIRTLRCPGGVGNILSAAIPGLKIRQGVVLCMGHQHPRIPPAVTISHTPVLQAVYTLLEQCFEVMPPFNAWYPDVSHRMRHGCCRIACILEGDAVVSTAMTVAEADGHALLGQVATHPDYRRRGYAAACLLNLISGWQGERLYIIPANENAHRLYISLGFTPWSTWAELS